MWAKCFWKKQVGLLNALGCMVSVYDPSDHAAPLMPPTASKMMRRKDDGLLLQGETNHWVTVWVSSRNHQLLSVWLSRFPPLSILFLWPFFRSSATYRPPFSFSVLSDNDGGPGVEETLGLSSPSSCWLGATWPDDVLIICVGLRLEQPGGLLWSLWDDFGFSSSCILP